MRAALLLGAVGLVGCAHEPVIERVFRWDPPSPGPMVLYSADLPPGVEHATCAAVEAWRARGHHLRGCFLLGPGAEALIWGPDGLPRPGLILVLPDDGLDPGVLAETIMHADGERRMRTALILVGPDVDGSGLVMDHELGHAMGFGHVPMLGHLMHPAADAAGPSDLGLQWTR